MNKIILYSLFSSLVFFSCTSNKPPQTESCCKKQMSKGIVGSLPEESLYNVSDHFTDQQGKQMELRNFAGKITVVSMIFTHCNYACPRLTNDVKAIADRLQRMGINNVNYLLVSFDTKRDHPARLREFTKEHQLEKNWTLLTGDEEAVRQLSVLLNVQ
ncbi:MAG TPA: SCO family protein, partial [Flavisolibacter sp.]|nr:SCO family protein [Flavisolibacter sp.]